MNNHNSIADVISPKITREQMDEIMKSGVIPPHLIHHSRNRFSPAYCPCPAPTTPNVMLPIIDNGPISAISIKTSDKVYLMFRTNEFVPMPLAYDMPVLNGTQYFRCIYEEKGKLFCALASSPNSSFINDFTETRGTLDERMSLLGLDLLMRTAVFSEKPSDRLHADKQKQPNVKTYRVGKLPRELVSMKCTSTPEGDCWEVNGFMGHSSLITFSTSSSRSRAPSCPDVEAGLPTPIRPSAKRLAKPGQGKPSQSATHSYCFAQTYPKLEYSRPQKLQCAVLRHARQR